MMSRLLTAAALVFLGRILGAQSAPDSAQCRAVLGAASPDSQSTRISILVSPVDSANHLSTDYGELIGAGIFQFIAVPKPLPLHVYAPRTALLGSGRPDTVAAALTLRGAYHATLHRDGHLTRIHVVSGTRDAAFDAAVVQAMEQLSASELLPPPSAPGTTFRGDSLELRVLVTPEAMTVLPRTVSSLPARGVTPVVLLRLPIRRITQDVKARPGNWPVYPTELRRAGIQGSTTFEFVVDTGGRIDLASVAVMSTSAPQFVDAVADVLPDLRFEPLRVEGCPASVLIQMPFSFILDNQVRPPHTKPVEERDRRRSPWVKREPT